MPKFSLRFLQYHEPYNMINYKCNLLYIFQTSVHCDFFMNPVRDKLLIMLDFFFLLSSESRSEPLCRSCSIYYEQARKPADCRDHERNDRPVAQKYYWRGIKISNIYHDDRSEFYLPSD